MLIHLDNRSLLKVSGSDAESFLQAQLSNNINDLDRSGMKLLAEKEGILTDPVYSGRAMGGLIDLIRKNKFKSTDKVLFWHTGGGPALFHYGNTIL